MHACIRTYIHAYICTGDASEELHATRRRSLSADHQSQQQEQQQEQQQQQQQQAMLSHGLPSHTRRRPKTGPQKSSNLEALAEPRTPGSCFLSPIQSGEQAELLVIDSPGVRMPLMDSPDIRKTPTNKGTQGRTPLRQLQVCDYSMCILL